MVAACSSGSRHADAGKSMLDDEQPWRPLSREELRQLRRDDRLRDRSGREWTVRGASYLDPEGGGHRAVLVSGAQVLIKRERFHDSYMLLAE
jgi:hypothetical protein